MNKVKKACEKFDGDLEGTFYCYETLKEDQKKQLMEDCFLFK